VVADEINRAPPRTQSGLLEAMQEGRVTIDEQTHELPRPFLVMATQNPLEHHGTYPLPESQLDRFLMRLTIGYPDERAERQILLESVGGQDRGAELQPVLNAGAGAGPAGARGRGARGRSPSSTT
jgi:MoxR-like ATPase